MNSLRANLNIPQRISCGVLCSDRRHDYRKKQQLNHGLFKKVSIGELTLNISRSWFITRVLVGSDRYFYLVAQV